MISYSQTLHISQHLASFIKIAEQLPCPSKPEAFAEAVKLWRATVPDSPILPILEANY